MATVDGAIFMSDSAHTAANFGFSYPSKPQVVVRNHVEAALEHHNYTPDVTVSYDYSFDTDDYDDSGKDLVDLRDLYWRELWLDGHDDAAQDFNLLLLNEDEWPNPDGSRGVSTRCPPSDDSYPSGGVILDMVQCGEHDESADQYGMAGDAVEDSIRGGVHEIGHQIGMNHSDGLRYNAWISGWEITRATPMGCPTGSTNACNTTCSSNSTEEWDHYYGNCEESNSCL